RGRRLTLDLRRRPPGRIIVRRLDPVWSRFPSLKPPPLSRIHSARAGRLLRSGGDCWEDPMRQAWMAGLLWMLGCGGAAQPRAPAASSSSELLALRAQLGAGAQRPEIAAGDDSIDVPPSVFGTTTDVVGRFLFVAVREPSGRVHGLYRVSEAADGSTFHYSG